MEQEKLRPPRREDDLLLLCAGCHKQLHALFTEKELERRLHDLPSLLAEPEVQKFVAWIKDKPPGFKPGLHPSPVHGGQPAAAALQGQARRSSASFSASGGQPAMSMD